MSGREATYRRIKNNEKFENCRPKKWSRKSGHAFVTNERWSFTRGSNCNNLTRKMLVVSISVIKVDTYARRSVYQRWSHMDV